MKISEIKKIVVIRLSSLGDVILTTPVVRALKSKYKEAIIDFVTSPASEEVYTNSPRINNLLLYSKKGDNSNLYSILMKKNYDLVLDFQHNKHSSKIVKATGKSSYKITKPQLAKFLLVHFKINLFGKIKKIPERYADVLSALKLDDKGPEMFPAGLDKVEQEDKLIGFCPGSKHFTKQYPEEYYAKLGKLLNDKGYKVALFGGSDDKEICERLHLSIKKSINLYTENKLHQLLLNMKRCKLIVCNDSGLMHAATAIDVPVAVIFGSTVGEFGFKPWKSKSLVLEDSTVNCRPCSHIGKGSCPKMHFNCMMNLYPELVFNEIKNLI